MPKLKTHRGAAKRVKVTGSGKLLRGHAFSNHFLAKKRASRKRTYARSSEFSSSDASNVKRMAGK